MCWRVIHPSLGFSRHRCTRQEQLRGKEETQQTQNPAGMGVWTWNQNPSVSKREEKPSSQTPSCLHTHWDGWAQRTGRWFGVLPLLLDEDVLAMGWDIPDLAQIYPKVAADRHDGNLILWSCCPDERSHSTSCRTHGSWCYFMSHKPQALLKVFPSQASPN